MLPTRCAAIAETCDLVVHAGDFSDGGALDEARSLGPPLIAVHGNVDTADVRERLETEASFDADGHTICVVHDAGPAKGRLRRMQRRFPEADAVIFGHSHMPLHETDSKLQIFNPGSPTQRRRAPRHTMGLLHTSADELRFELIGLD